MIIKDDIYRWINVSKYSAKRVLCWFSCGVTSAVACWLVNKYLEKDLGVEIITAYCDTNSEHEDNLRFLIDCENVFNYNVKILKSEKYRDIYDVFLKEKWLVGVQGARCTTELKKKVRQDFQQPEDIHVFGFDSSERKRLERFKKNNPEIRTWAPLIDNNISKDDCKQIIADMGIELPIMYKLGFDNNNCVGCVKGGIKYWLKIKEHFPDRFEKTAKIERQLGHTILRKQKNGKRFPIFLDELEDSHGKNEKDEKIDCGLFCPLAKDSS